MKTIQTTTANMIYYLAKDANMKKRLMDEILPAVAEASDNIVDGLSYDTVIEFDYLQQCFNESMRIEPAVRSSFNQTFTEDTIIGKNRKYLFKKGTNFQIMFEVIHHDPV